RPAAVPAAVLCKVDLRGPAAPARPEQHDAGDAVARVHAEPDQVFPVGLFERLGAGHAAGDPAVAVGGVLVGLQFEHAVLNHHVGGVPQPTRVGAGVALAVAEGVAL